MKPVLRFPCWSSWKTLEMKIIVLQFLKETEVSECSTADPEALCPPQVSVSPVLRSMLHTLSVLPSSSLCTHR